MYASRKYGVEAAARYPPASLSLILSISVSFFGTYTSQSYLRQDLHYTAFATLLSAQLVFTGALLELSERACEKPDRACPSVENDPQTPFQAHLRVELTPTKSRKKVLAVRGMWRNCTLTIWTRECNLPGADPSCVGRTLAIQTTTLRKFVRNLHYKTASAWQPMDPSHCDPTCSEQKTVQGLDRHAPKPPGGPRPEIQ